MRLFSFIGEFLVYGIIVLEYLNLYNFATDFLVIFNTRTMMRVRREI